MANDFEVGQDVAVAPDVAWALAGDPARVHEWFPAVAECEVEGDVRRATMRNGIALVERLVDRDDAARTYSYRVESGIPGLIAHRATIRVVEADGGCRVLWRQQATSSNPEYDAQARLSGVMSGGLERMRDMLEGRS